MRPEEWKQLGDAIVLWSGYGDHSWPQGSEERVVKHFGKQLAGFASPERWRAAYSEINAFEEQLVQGGIVLAKFWVHITPEEQERRFSERQETPYKRWKLTAEDWRNRAQWDKYEQAVHEMVERTSTHEAPWTLVEGNDKRYARVKIIKTVCDRLEKAIASRDKD